MKRNHIFQSRRTILIFGLAAAGLVLTAEGASLQAGTNDAKAKIAGKRDPFWPIGYQPAYAVQSGVSRGSTMPVQNNSWNEAMKKVIINGVSSRTDNEYFAVINGDVKRVGDTVSVQLGPSVYTWAVDGIESPGSVKLRRLSVRQG